MCKVRQDQNQPPSEMFHAWPWFQNTPIPALVPDGAPMTKRHQFVDGKNLCVRHMLEYIF